MTGTIRVALIDHDGSSPATLIAGLEDVGCAVKPMTTEGANTAEFQAQGAHASLIRPGDELPHSPGAIPHPSHLGTR